MTHFMGRSPAADTSLVEVRQAGSARFVGRDNYPLSPPRKMFQEIFITATTAYPH